MTIFPRLRRVWKITCLRSNRNTTLATYWIFNLFPCKKKWQTRSIVHLLYNLCTKFSINIQMKLAKWIRRTAMNERACSLKWWTLRKLLALPSPRRITQWRITSGIATIEEHTAHYAQARISCAYGRIRSMDHVDPGSCRKISWKRLFPSANRSLVLDTLREKTYSPMENRSSLPTCVGRSTFFCFCYATFGSLVLHTFYFRQELFGER